MKKGRFRKNRLSVEELKNFKGFEDISKEEGEHVVKSLEEYARIVCSISLKQLEENVIEGCEK